MKKNIVALLSGGLDSSVNVLSAHQKENVVLALTFDYGQRAVQKEIASARKICEWLGVPHKVISLPFFQEFGKSSLIDLKSDVPAGAQVAIDNYETSLKTAKSVWVPNRNGIFLNIAAGFAEALGAQGVLPGFNKEEATTFPDNSVDFLESLNHSFSFSTSNQVEVICYTAHMTKSEIVKKGQSLGMDWSLLWPCYHAFERWCGQCESCLRSKRAFVSAGVEVQELFST